MLAACTSESENGPSANISYESIAATQQVPVTFGTYIGEQATTRAGKTGPIDTDALKLAQGSGGGFGVFGYYTDHSDYVASGGSASPVNFMYNQGVFWNSTSTSWEYTPVKYWPNETANGYVDGTTATSASSTGGPDKLTFFAYAPYVSSPSYDGVVSPTTYGITGLTANTDPGDPIVAYTVTTNPAQTVDLLWAVAPADQTTPTVSGGTWSNVSAGMPYIDLVKPKLSPGSTVVDFSFKHALAKLTFTVQGAFDAAAPGDTDVDANTRIVIDNVAVTTTGLHKNGLLNLNNTTEGAGIPKWSIDGAVLIPAINISSDIVAGSAGAAGLKYNSGTDTYAGQPLGVTKTAQPLMDAAKFFGFIPETTDMTVTITYHVFTADPSLHDQYSKITNVITKTITGLALQGSNAYTINMVLGMETVSFNATVSPWTNVTPATVVNLPLNVTTP